MKNRLIIKSLIKTSVLLFVFSIGQAEEITKVGTSAAGFLQMENGSRAMAMGGSLVADANDASAVFWNPASVGISNKFSSYYEQTQLYADISQYNIGFSYPLNGNQSLAILINYLDLGRMDITTVLEPEGTGNTFDAASYFMAAAYAKSLTDRVRVGLSFKLFEERIWLEKANGFA
ncbi:MAG: PorV/PorQ family protein, partial [Candidatus Marinimicrobia bacterium]|nr:PorV/PorQ family protein [Candidatus Neomarinimicrobiota bacterium]